MAKEGKSLQHIEDLKKDLLAMANNPPTSREFTIADSDFVRYVDKLPDPLRFIYLTVYDLISRANNNHISSIINSIKMWEEDFGLQSGEPCDPRNRFGRCAMPVRLNRRPVRLSR